MDRLILEQLNRTTPTPKLARLNTPRAVLLGAYVAGKSYPVWLAKFTGNETSRNRLRREHQAMVHLARHAQQLGVPQILAWKDDDTFSLLIREGMSGEADNVAIPLNAPQELFRERFDPAVEWLLRFQATISPPKAISQQAVAERLIEWLRERTSFHPAMGRMSLAIAGLLPKPEKPAVAVHGDFFPRNVLKGPCAQVIDWDCFDSGLPLHDLLYLFVGADLYHNRKLVPMDHIAKAALFSEMPIRQALFGYMERLGIHDPAEIAFNVYCYLAHLLETSAGDIEEQAWMQMLHHVDRAGYPPPGTALAI